MVNVAHQMGGTLGLGILIAFFAHASNAPLTGITLLSHQISVAVLGGSIMVFIALLVALFMIVPASNAATRALS